MAVSLKQAYDIAWDGTHNACIMNIFVDSVSDLTGLIQLDDIYFQLGSWALDVSTGDEYRFSSNGTWVLQPSNNRFVNVYTKAEVDAIITDVDADIQDVQDDLNLHLASAPALKFTPETSSPSITNGQRVRLSSANSNNIIEFLVGKLNSTTNYIQFYVNGVDKGYITFDVSRNIDVWSN